MTIKPTRNLLLLAVVVTMLNFQSCSKYEDGKFSLRSKTNRLTGEWEVVDVQGSDLSNSEITFDFEKEGDFEITVEYSYYGYSYTYSQSGDWSFEDNKETLEIELDGEDAQEFEIKRLTNSELVLEDEYGDEWELEKM